MVDVSKIGGQLIPDKQAQPKKSQADGTFGNFLDRAQKEMAPKEVSQTAPLAPPMAIQPVASFEEMAAQQADKLLGLLESYAQALENPGTSLKAMAPMVKEMELEANAAKRVLAQIDVNQGVGRIANQAAVHASVEAFKFHRGDYV